MRIFSWVKALCVLSVLMLSSCGSDDDDKIFDDINTDIEDLKSNPKVVATENEISSGKLFTIESGTVTYKDGTVLSFSNYGRKFYLDVVSRSYAVIWDGENLYQLDHVFKTYTVLSGESISLVAVGEVREYVFNDEFYKLWYEKVSKYGDVSGEVANAETRTIAGKDVTVYVNGDDEYGKQYTAGWNRIILLDGDGSENNPDNIIAVSIKESYSGSFTVPAGYMLESNEYNGGDDYNYNDNYDDGYDDDYNGNGNGSSEGEITPWEGAYEE